MVTKINLKWIWGEFLGLKHMQNNVMPFYIYFKENEKVSLEILANGKRHTLFCVLLQFLFNYLQN